MEPIFLIIILGFIVFAGWYFIWPRKSKEIQEPKPTSSCVAPAIHYEPISETLDKLDNKQVQISRERFGDKNTVKLLTHRNFELRRRCEKKIYDLQEQLKRNGKDGFELAPNDLIRYKAMIEVLKAMIN